MNRRELFTRSAVAAPAALPWFLSSAPRETRRAHARGEGRRDQDHRREDDPHRTREDSPGRRESGHERTGALRSGMRTFTQRRSRGRNRGR